MPNDLLMQQSRLDTGESDFTNWYDKRNSRFPRQLTNMFEAFSCIHLHPNPMAWRLDRLEGMPSVLDDVRSAQCSIKNFPLSREKVLEHVSLGIH